MLNRQKESKVPNLLLYKERRQLDLLDINKKAVSDRVPQVFMMT